MLAKTVRYSQDGPRLAMLLNFSQGSCVMFCLLVLAFWLFLPVQNCIGKWQLCLPVQTWKTTIRERGREKPTFSCRILCSECRKPPHPKFRMEGSMVANMFLSLSLPLNTELCGIQRIPLHMILTNRTESILNAILIYIHCHITRSLYFFFPLHTSRLTFI